MKKFASLVLSLSLCMGLATTAFADSHMVYDDDGNLEVTFDNVIRTEEEIGFRDLETGEVGSPVEVVMLVAMPDFSATEVKEDSLAFSFYEYNGTGYENSGAVWEHYPPTSTVATIDDMFFKSWSGEYDYDRIYYIGTDNATGKGVWLKLGDGTQTTPAQSEQTTTPTDSATPAAPATADSYTAVKYDTWGQIALNNYGSYGAWQQLYKANNYAKLTEGTVINLPETLGKYTRIGAPVAAEGEKLYTVKAGDTLGNIAKAVYGDAMKYKAIFERNADRLKNANTIYEGQVIVLPAK